MTYASALLFGYLLGSIPFGLVLCKIFGYGDIRKIGSGNIGATNVLRTGNKLLAFITLILDSGKGAIAVLTAIVSYSFNKHYFPDQNLEPIITIAFIAGLGAILGHCFPIWLKFKGGKGVATTLGTLLAAAPLAGLIACGTWLLSALIFRISSLAALIAMWAAPVATYFIYGETPAIICAAMTVLVWIKHHENIRRILKGEEPKIGKKKKVIDVTEPKK